MRAPSPPLPKMMLGFVVRRCAVAIGHDPSPEEFAVWANSYHDGDRTVYLFGRPISVGEARVILRHRARPVSARSSASHEQMDALLDVVGPASNVTSFEDAVARLKARRK